MSRTERFGWLQHDRQGNCSSVVRHLLARRVELKKLRYLDNDGLLGVEFASVEKRSEAQVIWKNSDLNRNRFRAELLVAIGCEQV